MSGCSTCAKGSGRRARPLPGAPGLGVQASLPRGAHTPTRLSQASRESIPHALLPPPRGLVALLRRHGSGFPPRANPPPKTPTSPRPTRDPVQPGCDHPDDTDRSRGQ